MEILIATVDHPDRMIIVRVQWVQRLAGLLGSKVFASGAQVIVIEVPN